MTIQEQYVELQKSRKKQSTDVLNNKKRVAWEFFRNYTDVRNLEKNMLSNFELYLAPVKSIRGSNMVCWSNERSKEIYVDEPFSLKYPELVNVQLQHEILHGLSYFKNDREYVFGHQYDNAGKSIYTGINEAVTQMFAEDITGIRLDENVDYLYSVKNVMRVMKIIFGIEDVAGQYLNNSNNFETRFNEITSFKFEPFSLLMNDVYVLSKNKNYVSLTDEQNEELNNKKDRLFNFTSSLINQLAQNDPTLINRICDELKDESIQEKLDVSKIELQESGIHRR